MTAIVVQHLLNVLVIGGIYAAVAVGLTLIFGTVRLIQFAHGEVCVLGAFAALATFSLWEWAFGPGPVWLMLAAGLAAALITGGGVGSALERVVFRPIRDRSPVLTLVVSLGLAIVIRETLAIVWPNGRSPQPFLPSLSEYTIATEGVTLSPIGVLVALGGFVLV